MLVSNSWLDYERATIGVPLFADPISLVAGSARTYVHGNVYYFNV